MYALLSLMETESPDMVYACATGTPKVNRIAKAITSVNPNVRKPSYFLILTYSPPLTNVIIVSSNIISMNPIITSLIGSGIAVSNKNDVGNRRKLLATSSSTTGMTYMTEKLPPSNIGATSDTPSNPNIAGLVVRAVSILLRKSIAVWSEGLHVGGEHCKIENNALW
jgi:hypothetical protein